MTDNQYSVLITTLRDTQDMLRGTVFLAGVLWGLFFAFLFCAILWAWRKDRP